MAKQTFTTGQILTAAQMTTLQANDYNWTVNAKTTSYTLVATDAGTRVTMTSASATTITVNTSLFTAGDTLEIINLGTGICTITAGTATVSTAGSLALGQYESGVLYFNSTSAAVFFDYYQAGAVSPLTTKGDLYTYSTVDTRLGVGTNGQVLQADSTAATGLKWATAASGGGMTLISTTTLSGASVTLSSIPNTYINLQLVINNFTNNTADGIVRIAANGGTDYAYASTLAAGTVGNYGPAYVQTITNAQRTDNASSLQVTFYGYALDDFIPFFLNGAVKVSGGYTPQTASGYTYAATSAGISSLVISNSGGTWAGGTVYLYGVK